MVVVALPLEAPRGSRATYVSEWLSFWSSRPLLAPDEVHARAFTAWVRLGYPFLALAAVALWLIDEVWPGQVSPTWFFAGVIFGVASGVLHLVRSMSNLPTPTLGARLIAGWPLELAVATTSVVAAWGIFG